MAVENDETELWREYRRAQQQRREDRLGPRTEEILALRGKGFSVVALTVYHFRIDDALDLFPIHRRYHDLKTQQRGGYRNVMDIAIRRIRQRQEAAMENGKSHEGAVERDQPDRDPPSAQGDGDPRAVSDDGATDEQLRSAHEGSVDTAGEE